MDRVLISGGSGLVGKALCEKLKTKGYDVGILSRSKNTEVEFKTFLWNPDNNEIETEAIATADYIIHLAGASIADKRWTAQRRKIIVDSRVRSANFIFNQIQNQNKQLKAYISASAVGYYGAINSGKIFTENDAAACDFLGDTCFKWERSASQFKEIGIRTTIMRTGLVLSKTGGALQKMLIPAKMGFASAIGNGKQYIPWIHIDDLCEFYIKAIEDNQVEGKFNVVAPEFQTNQNFTQVLTKVLDKPFWFPKVPAFVLKIIMGEMSDLLLKGSRVSADKIISTGFSFRFPKLEDAIKDLVG